MSGSAKLKNAALGLRQNRRRSSRYWRHTSVLVLIAALPRGGGGRRVRGAGAAGASPSPRVRCSDGLSAVSCR